MARRIWAGALAGYVIPLVEYVHQLGADVDADLLDPDIPVTVEVGQILSFAAEQADLSWPAEDRFLIEYLRQHARPSAALHLWVVVVTPDQRLGFVVPGGVIETTGEHLTRVERPEPDRYAEIYYLPSTYYVGANRGERYGR